MKTIWVVLLLMVIAGCASSGRYSQHADSKPKSISREIDFKDVEPVFEPYSVASMRPYTVLGKYYQPLKTGKGYSRIGEASWYGQKFHGHLTANGETYNMFAMTAAHTTLPLPSIVRVTNLENGKQAVVRVNDRGPFHPNRIIDLSYAAAMKLGVLKTGVAKVKVDVMHVDNNGVLTVGNQLSPIELPTSDQRLFIQVAALQDYNRVQDIAKGLQSLYQMPVATPNENGLFRLHIGPLENESQADILLQQLKNDGYSNAFRLYTPISGSPQ